MLTQLAPYFISLVILCIVAEAIYSSKKQLDLYDRKDTWTSIGFGILGVVSRIFMKSTNIAIWLAVYHWTPLKIETNIWTLLLLYFSNEFIFYWFHRWSHEFSFLWATHVNHHSSNKMNFSVAARTPFMNAIHHVVFWLPLPLLGFDPLMILLVETISFLAAFIQHTTLIPKLGVIEWVFNTPSHHRVHHASNPNYINKNYGNTLIIFDRLFGTFKEETEEAVYGITINPIDRGFWNMIFHGWVEAFRNFRIKIKKG